jgi:hypothetical protein
MIEISLFYTRNKRFEPGSQGADNAHNRHPGLFLCVNHQHWYHVSLFPVNQ